MRTLAFCFVAITACSADTETTPAVEDIPDTTEVEVAEETTEDVAEPDVPEPDPIEARFRTTVLGLEAVGVGFDLNEDGTPDNALATLFEEPDIANLLGGDPNAWIAKEVDDGDLNLLFDVRDLHAVTDDDDVGLDLVLGQANVKGGYDVLCESLTEDGEPSSRFDGLTLESGVLSGGPGEFRFAMSFAQGTVLVFRDARISVGLRADKSELFNGRLGGAMKLSELKAVLDNDPEVGEQFAGIIMAYLQGVADLDTDGDDVPDAMSAAFAFTAAATTIHDDAPCVE